MPLSFFYTNDIVFLRDVVGAIPYNRVCTNCKRSTNQYIKIFAKLSAKESGERKQRKHLLYYDVCGIIIMYTYNLSE